MAELEDLLLSAQPMPLDSGSSQEDPYNRGSLRAFASAGRDQSLKEFYVYVFSLARAESVLRFLCLEPDSLIVVLYSTCRGQRNVDIEVRFAILWPIGSDPLLNAGRNQTAVALWSVILAPRYPIIADLLAYIAVSFSLRVLYSWNHRPWLFRRPMAMTRKKGKNHLRHIKGLQRISGKWYVAFSVFGPGRRFKLSNST